MRQYELDVLRHVNNAVYVNWVEQVAVDHVEALGSDRAWARRRAARGWSASAIRGTSATMSNEIALRESVRS